MADRVGTEEKTYNVFVDVTDGIVKSLGVREHLQKGTDESKGSFLQSHVAEDHSKALRFPIPPDVVSNALQAEAELSALTWEDYCLLCTIGKQMVLFERVLSNFQAPREPLMVITPIVDGKIEIQGREQITNPDFSQTGRF